MAKFREIGSVANANEGHSGRCRSVTTTNSIKNLPNGLRNLSENQRAVYHKLAFPNHLF